MRVPDGKQVLACVGCKPLLGCVSGKYRIYTMRINIAIDGKRPWQGELDVMRAGR
jgi:hypothetical protein